MAMKARLARHLLGVSVADITLSAQVCNKDDTVVQAAKKTTNLFKSVEQRVRDRLLERIGARERAIVTEVTATIVTSHVPRAKQILVKLQAHTERSMSAVLGNTLGDSTFLHSVNSSQSSDIKRTGMRRRLLAYAAFWQRMADQTMTLVIFSVLLVLSMLPILRIQTAILFNRAFATIIANKIHKQELLEDLYTPGLFYQVQAEESEKKEGNNTFGKTLRGARKQSVAIGRAIGRKASLLAPTRGRGTTRQRRTVDL